MPNTPPILVVTPTLGSSPYLENCVATTAALNLNTTHVICCPQPMVSEVQARFPACRVLADGGKQGGMYEAINVGLREGRPDIDWFTYINDDDQLTPNFAKMFQAFTAVPGNESRIAFGDVRYIDAKSRSLGLMPTERKQRHFIPLLQSGITPLSQQGMLVGPQVLKRIGFFDSRLRQVADLDFWVRCMMEGINFQYFPLEVAHFRFHAGQLSSNREQVYEEMPFINAKINQVRVSAIQRFLCMVRFRISNIPRYIERIRTTGWASGEELTAGKVTIRS